MATTATWTTTHIPGQVRIAVDQQGEGPLAVFLHGVGGNRTNWHEQLPAFAEHFSAVSWDARGYGLSDDYEGPLHPLDFVEDLVRLLDHYGVEKAHLVGLSMGGGIIQNFYKLHPDRVATLVLCDTRPPGAPQSPEARARFLELRVKPLQEGKTPRDMAPAVAETLIGRKSPRDKFDRLVESMAALHKESYIKTIEGNSGVADPLDISTIKVPTMLVFGEDDRLTPPDVGREMQKAIPGSEFVEIEIAGHLTNIEQPDLFNRAVLDFLLRHKDLAK